MRDLKQTWTGMILRGKFPIPLERLALIHRNCIEASSSFFEGEAIDYHRLSFEDLLINPDKSIDDINNYIGTSLAVADLKKLYKGRLYEARWSKKDFLKAKIKFFYYKYLLKDVINFPRKV